MADPSIHSIASRLVLLIGQTAFPKGARSELKRFDATDEGSSAPLTFYRLAVEALPEGWDRTTHTRRAWRTLVQSMALFPEAGDRPLGEAMADAGISEARVERLLEAPPGSKALCLLWLRIARMLAAKHRPFLWGDVARLLLSEQRDAIEAVHRHIATSYYRARQQEAIS